MATKRILEMKKIRLVHTRRKYHLSESSVLLANVVKQPITSFQQLIRRNRELIDLVTRTRNEKLDNVFVQTRMSNEG